MSGGTDGNKSNLISSSYDDFERKSTQTGTKITKFLMRVTDNHPKIKQAILRVIIWWRRL